jgi:uncharacterized protein (DUF433 family)
MSSQSFNPYGITTGQGRAVRGIREAQGQPSPFAAIQATPTGRPSLSEIAPSVMLDASIRGGHPCVKGTALPTIRLWEAFTGKTRRSIRAIARDHRISEEAVEDVLRYELTNRSGQGFIMGSLEGEDATRQIDEMLDDWLVAEGRTVKPR